MSTISNTEFIAPRDLSRLEQKTAANMVVPAISESEDRLNASTLARCIAISSQKGGVSKTTTTFNLSACLADLGMSVLVVDLDPQANLTQSFGIDPDSARHTAGDALLNQASILEVSRESKMPNLDIVPANRGLILAEKLLYSSQGYELRLKSCLEIIGYGYYDFVLFDCPPSFGPLTLNALTVSEMVITPVTCDFYSVQSLHAFMKLLAMIRRKTNPDLTQRLLISMYDKRTRVSQLMMNQYRQKFGDLVFETVIPVDTKLRESPLFGRPINQYAFKARGAQEYRALARELMTCLKMTI